MKKKTALEKYLYDLAESITKAHEKSVTESILFGSAIIQYRYKDGKIEVEKLDRNKIAIKILKGE